MERGDQGERHRSLCRARRERPDQGLHGRLDQMGEDGLADEAERDAGHRDAELGGGDVVVQVAERLADPARRTAALGGELLDAGAPGRDEGELGGDEDRIEQQQRRDEEEAG